MTDSTNAPGGNSSYTLSNTAKELIVKFQNICEFINENEKNIEGDEVLEAMMVLNLVLQHITALETVLDVSDADIKELGLYVPMVTNILSAKSNYAAIAQSLNGFEHKI